MKKIVVTLLLCCSFSVLFAQKDSSRIEQYCTVVATPRILSTKVTISVDYGDRRSVWRDNRVKTEDGTLKKFNSVVDALNYMGKNGWSLVNAFPVTAGNNNNSNAFVYHYVFRKQFLNSEVEDFD